MRRQIYKKIVSIVPILIVVFLVVSYFIGSQENKNNSTKITESSQNLAVVQNTQKFVTTTEESTSVSGGSIAQNNLTQPNSQNYQNAVLIPVSLKVQEKTYTIKIKEGSSAYELMKQLQIQGLQFSGVEHIGIGFYVSEINGLTEDKKARSYWTLYINGKESNVGVSALTLKSDDIIEWKYETRN